MPRTVQNTDMLVTHLPIARYVHSVMEQYHQIPLWNSLQFSGQPLAADPLTGYWYLPNWLTYIWPQPAAFNVLFVLHYTWAGLGLFILMKSYGLRSSAAFLSAIIFIGTPKLAAYVGSGQVSSVFAVSWLPWMLLVVRQSMPKGGYRNGIYSAAVLAIIILIDIRWGFYAGLLACAYAVSRIGLSKAGLKRAVTYFLAFTLSTTLLTLGMLLPFVEFLSFTRRYGLSITESLIYRITPDLLIGIFTPQWGIICELVVYFGIIPLLVFIINFNYINRFWKIIALITFMASIGIVTILLSPLAAALPVVSLLRVPSRLWFVLVLCIAIMAGLGLDNLYTGNQTEKQKKRIQLFLFGFGVLALLFSSGMTLLLRSINPGIVQFGVAGSVSAVVLAFVVSKRLNKNQAALALILLVSADLLAVNTSYLTHVPLSPDAPAVEWISKQSGLFRTYSPSYSLPMPNLLQQAHGVNPMHMQSYADYMAKASGIDVHGYSVSVPDIYIDANTPQSMIESASYPDSKMLGLLNVKFLAASFQLKSPGLDLVAIVDDVFIYKNNYNQERVWMEQGQVNIQSWSPNRVEIQTNGSLVR
jgi:hypothetical protein